MASAPPEKTFFERWIGVIAAVLGVVSTILTIWTGYLATQVNRLNQQLSATNAERDWSGKIFDKYSSAVTAKDLTPDQRIAALAPLANLVILISNDDVRSGLGQSIKDQTVVYQRQLESKSQTQTADPIAQAQTEAVIRQAQAVAETAQKAIQPSTAPKPTAAAYNFDIFWCESVPGAEGLAGRIAALKGGMPAPIGRWRTRMLADAVNARPGYNKRGFIINYNSSDELPLAQKLQELIGTDGTLTSRLPAVRILPVTMNTPGYLSVFVCPN